MNWINLRTELLRTPEFANAKPGAIETWLRVLAYCCEQENDGRLAGAATWTERAWMTTCGVTKAEVENAAPLIYDDAVDVFVDGFPSEKQAEVQAKRKAGKKGGRSSGRSRASSTASRLARTEGEGEGEEEVQVERKENKNGEKEPPSSPAADASHPWEGDWRRLGKLFRRRESTQPTQKELKALKVITPIPAEDFKLIEAYYNFSHPPAADYRRRDLQTLLNNWPGELDRARRFRPTGGAISTIPGEHESILKGIEIYEC